MLKFKSAVLAVFVAVSGVFAGVGFQAEVGTLNFSDLMIGNSDVMSTKIGCRISGAGSMAFDVLLGFGSLSEVPYDQSIGQSGDQKMLNVGVTIGVCATVHSGEKTRLSFLGRYGISMAQDGQTYQDSSYAFQFDYNTLLYHTIFAGLEPSFKLGENMEIFSNYGICVRINPATKDLGQSGGPGTPTSWNQMKDGTTGISFSGILLGFRYYL